MGHGTSSNFWNSGNDGVRITVVDASSGTAVSSPLDFSNRTQKTSLLHFGKVNKLQYLGGAGLSLQSGVAYSCIRPTQSMPTIVSSKGQSNIEAIKRYFCSEYACMMVAQAAGVDYERMIAGEYKLLIEPIAYFTHNGQYVCFDLMERTKNWTQFYQVWAWDADVTRLMQFKVKKGSMIWLAGSQRLVDVRMKDGKLEKKLKVSLNDFGFLPKQPAAANRQENDPDITAEPAPPPTEVLDGDRESLPE